MTSQQIADDLLREHQAARVRLSIDRSEHLKDYYDAERRQGVDALTANERMHAHAKRLDGEFESDLSIIRKCMERTI